MSPLAHPLYVRWWYCTANDHCVSWERIDRAVHCAAVIRGTLFIAREDYEHLL